MPLPTGRIEWISRLAEQLPMIMVARILGLDDSAAPALKEQGYASVEAISGFVTEERFAELGAPMMNVGPVVDAYFASARDTGVRPGHAHRGVRKCSRRRRAH